MILPRSVFLCTRGSPDDVHIKIMGGHVSAEKAGHHTQRFGDKSRVRPQMCISNKFLSDGYAAGTRTVL